MDIKKQFGRRVRQLRRYREISQEQLADKIGRFTKTISYMETGKTFPKAEQLPVIADALGVEVYELFIFKDLLD